MRCSSLTPGPSPGSPAAALMPTSARRCPIEPLSAADGPGAAQPPLPRAFGPQGCSPCPALRAPTWPRPAGPGRARGRAAVPSRSAVTAAGPARPGRARSAVHGGPPAVPVPVPAAVAVPGRAAEPAGGDRPGPAPAHRPAGRGAGGGLAAPAGGLRHRGAAARRAAPQEAAPVHGGSLQHGGRRQRHHPRPGAAAGRCGAQLRGQRWARGGGAESAVNPDPRGPGGVWRCS